MSKKIKMEKKNTKRANVLDWFYIISILFALVVCVITGTLILSTVTDSNVFADYEDANASLQYATNSLLSFDNIMMFVIVGLGVFVLVSSALVFNHPVYFWSGVFLLAIAVTTAAIASNTIWTFLNTDALTATAANFPKMAFLMDNLPLYVAFLGLASLAIMYVSYVKGE